MRIGKSHQEVAVVLLGAFSRYVNHLEDEDMSQPRTKQMLRNLRMFADTSEAPMVLADVLARIQSETCYRFRTSDVPKRSDRVFPADARHE